MRNRSMSEPKKERIPNSVISSSFRVDLLKDQSPFLGMNALANAIRKYQATVVSANYDPLTALSGMFPSSATVRT